MYRVEWYPGSDQLLGTCFCGAERLADDPIEVWDWLLEHPAGHVVLGLAESLVSSRSRVTG